MYVYFCYIYLAFPPPSCTLFFLFMKPLQNFLQILLFLGCTTLHAQDNQWTWVSGDHITETVTNYGTKGIAAATNHPGPRSESTTCTDRNGNFWLFGGKGKDSTGKEGILNDLWKWDGTYWTWMAGSNLANQAGNFGSQGIASPSNIPPSRAAGICGFDNNGNLWLFGGSYDGAGTLNSINDLWKWDGNNWTWVKGTNNVNWQTADYWGHYGANNFPSVTNTPGGRSHAVGWTDSIGNLWLFGGDGYADSSVYVLHDRIGLLNDLWKWDGNNWTWIRGNIYAQTSGIYGTKGISANFNYPGARSYATVIKDKNGVIWMFGGNTSFLKDQKVSNDLWKWDGTNWTWMSGSDTASQTPVFGQMGIPGANNVPEAGLGYNGWSDSLNNLFLFGGDNSLLGGLMEILWKWDGTNWTWIRGDTLKNSSGNYGVLNVANNNNTPASRTSALSWEDKNGGLFLYGGFGLFNTAIAARNLNDTWYFDGNNWIWKSGAPSKNSISFGEKGIAAASNQPSVHYGGVTWQDNKGDLWLFSGEGRNSYYSIDLYNNMWKWDGSNWTWMNGSDKPNQLGNLGIRGIPSSTNIPAARYGAQSWYDNNGIFWLFGGFGIDTLNNNLTNSTFNDLWKWDGANWTWVKGGKYNNTWYGTYGQKGIPDTANNPTARYLGNCWTDKAGNLWLYGGFNRGFYLNDLWKWDGTNWTWVKGDSTKINSIPAVYGTIGVTDPSNSPGSRANASIWKDSSDNVYLFGGITSLYIPPSRNSPNGNVILPVYNDLWKWDGSNWTWLSGSSYGSFYGNPQTGNYGNKGISAATNLPPERSGAASWTDSRGNFWLYGGGGVNGYLNDLWAWDGKNWTWISGDSSKNNSGIYGTLGLNDPNNKPGGRVETFYWTDKKNNTFWLFGGLGIYNGSDIIYNDLWKFRPGIVTAIPSSLSVPNFNSKLLLLNNPSPLDRFQFRSDQFYQKLNWQIIDESGRMLQEGKLYTVLKGSFQLVTTQHLNKGTYFIRFLGEDKKMQTLKWIKQ